WRRLRRNRAAMASALVLAAVALAALIGPYLAPHAYDTVYPQYVRAPASLEPYPRQDAIQPEVEQALRRARVDIDAMQIDDGAIRVAVTSPRGEIDERITRYLDRSNLFDNTTIGEFSADRRSAVMVAPIQQFTFVFGTDGNG